MPESTAMLMLEMSLDQPRRAEFFRLVAEEVDRAYRKHGSDRWGRHEFFGVILEEVQEVYEAFRFRFILPFRMRLIWRLIRADAAQRDLEKEIIQVAAMCARYWETRDRYREPQ